ncbi:putative phospholipid-transporting ATPase IF [Lamellibrachia satsuma]|nr:putative phospholipid-transporting ATPase IF [Lamellibrachia satsuma]
MYSTKTYPGYRTIYVGNEHFPKDDSFVPPPKCLSNEVISSKYTAWNFIPKNLFEQFHRVANFYFLCVALIELIIDSPVSPVTSILPLVFVVTVTAFKQGYEDVLRHRTDAEVNSRVVHVLRDGVLQTLHSRDIQVGDIVKVPTNHAIPCDMVMLSSDNKDGYCYITTANLDGETNLKRFSSIKETRECDNVTSLTELCAVAECEQPTSDLYRFIGRITIQFPGGGEITRSLGPENLLLRSSRLKNSGFVFGFAVYTGQDTKISLNFMTGKAKFSRIEKRMNMYLLVFLVFLVLYSSIWVYLKYMFYEQTEHHHSSMWYLPKGEPQLTTVVVVEEFLSFMVLSNYIIPISLYVTLEFQKFLGSKFFQWDIEMYDPSTNEPAKALTSDLNEELGQVEYLFTDKTGTLTENCMVFRYCSINGERYEECEGKLWQSSPELHLLHEYSPDVEEMLVTLALCHTVHVERSDVLPQSMRSETGYDYDYQAISPDEKALIEACRRYGIVFHGLHENYLELTVQGQERRYLLHHLLEFDPVRKCMSVITEDESGKYMLLCKGADSTVLEKVTMGANLDTTDLHLTEYAKLGLRTLVIAKRELNTIEFEKFDRMLIDAKNALNNREELLSEVYACVESDLHLLGVTAIEDILQPGVRETLVALRKAGIKVWVLTGDKEETAINISYSAGHFHSDMVEVRLTKQRNATECEVTLKSIYSNLEDHKETQHALILDGVSLTYVLESQSTFFSKVCRKATTVLCCRMSPLQKSQVVRIIKRSYGRPITAAIGDGANDVSMIQEADVGLGIAGNEGRQAVRSSDYAIARFCFLQRALLLHGHYFYQRTATLVQYFFYKNVAMITAEIYFTFFSAFSAQSIFDSFLLIFFNMTFTALPIFLYGLFEQNTPQDDLLSDPTLYKCIRKNAHLSTVESAKWILLGLWHSVVFFYGTWLMLEPGTSSAQDGQMMGVYDFGVIIFTACVITVNIKLMLKTRYWNIIIFGGFAVSIMCFIVFTLVYSIIFWPSSIATQNNMFGSILRVFSLPSIWLTLLLLVVTALIPDLVLDVITSTQQQNKTIAKQESGYDTDHLSVSFTKHSGKWTVSQETMVEYT